METRHKKENAGKVNQDMLRADWDSKHASKQMTYSYSSPGT